MRWSITLFKPTAINLLIFLVAFLVGATTLLYQHQTYSKQNTLQHEHHTYLKQRDHL